MYGMQVHLENRDYKPRYTVELTTEGWQVKKPDGSFWAGVCASKEDAEIEREWLEGRTS